jgi:hypothetical protein
LGDFSDIWGVFLDDRLIKKDKRRKFASLINAPGVFGRKND